MTEDAEARSPCDVAVIGGEGFYGNRVVDALRRAGYRVSVAGRPPVSARKTVGVDLNDPSTFEALEPFDVVVVIANGVAAPSDALVSWADRGGHTVVEASAFAPFYRRVLARPRDGTGTIVLGAGVFPGKSTRLAVAAASEATDDGPPDAVDVAVSLSPLSGAGWGNAQLMATMLALPSFVWREGKRRERPTVGARRAFAFPSGERTAAQVDLPDVELVREATGAPNVTTWLALEPGVFLVGFRLLAWCVRWAGPFRRLLLGLLHLLLALFRGLILRDRTTPVEVVAEARGAGGAVKRAVRYDDGFDATAAGVVDAVEAAREVEAGWWVAGAITRERRSGAD
jgi:hypothetical protein